MTDYATDTVNSASPRPLGSPPGCATDMATATGTISTEIDLRLTLDTWLVAFCAALLAALGFVAGRFAR